VRDRYAYLFSSALPGPGGMPLGTQGRMLAMLDSEGAIASTWLMMKRGCSVLVVTEDESLVEPLRAWYPNLRIAHPEHDMTTLAGNNGCIGITLAWGLEEIEKRGAVKGDLPVFYPLVGMNEEETKGLLARIRG
jgi:thiamine biosynthesis protein ThiI